MMHFFASCPKGLEELLAQELIDLNAANTKVTRAGVYFDGELKDAYRACLWSRLASRIFLSLQSFEVSTTQDLYDRVRAIAWDQHLAANGTLAIDFSGTNAAISHSNFGALKVKDAICDQLRDQHGERPSVDTERPDVRVNVFLHRDITHLSIDLSGESLHRRGYRLDPVAAPLKENLACAILLRADWPRIAAANGTFVDLMCGSGTLCLEAAMMAGDIAPGLTREHFGFLRWQQHDRDIWAELIDEANTRKIEGLKKLPAIAGYDHDHLAIRSARSNARRLGLEGYVRFLRRDLAESASETAPAGLVLVNPPYGERIGEKEALPELYRTLGNQLKQHFQQWRVGIFTGNPEMGRYIGVRPQRKHTLFNGAIECKLCHYVISEDQYASDNPKPRVPASRSASAEMFANRLRKNLKKLGAWAQRENIQCYRLYDADMPEYKLAVDLYHSDKLYVHVQEYEAPSTIDPHKARQRLAESLDITAEILQIPTERIYLKQRRQQKGGGQYEKLAARGEFHEVREGPGKFLVNFTDYLDTGLFLDHRLTRQMLHDMANGNRFLNLFAYTGTATVYAALGGAEATATVDMSNTYLDWAKRNFQLNVGSISPWKHEFIQANVLDWLRDNAKRQYDLIFLDPPTFSRSKRMQGTLDIQRDHANLLQDVAKLLAPGGVVVFSNNLRKFKLDREAMAGFEVNDITAKTIPEDFKGNPKIHQCFLITRRRG